jgi:hypothetical protein
VSEAKSGHYHVAWEGGRALPSHLQPVRPLRFHFRLLDVS